MTEQNTEEKILVINPGSTSTKIAFFIGEDKRWIENIAHPADELAVFPRVVDQLDYRLEALRRELQKKGLRVEELTAIAARGGLLKPIPGGVYAVDRAMLEELREERYGRHASNLGALLAYELGSPHNVPSYIVDPICVDELEPVARISGLPQIQRRSVFHALNQKRQARRAAAELGKKYEEVNLIVAHLGGGITVGAHRRGRVVDVSNGVDGEGPLTPERSGSLPAAEVVQLAFSDRYTREELLRLINGRGGFVAYLGTNNAREVEERAAAGDTEADLLFAALCYQVAREIGACAAVLSGQVDAVVLTGGLAYSRRAVEEIRKRVEFIAPVLVYPGEDEMAALAEGVLRVLRGEEAPRSYQEEGVGRGEKDKSSGD
ncbi:MULTISPECIES: butyrate kinase [Desulfofundulus]|uniref:Probable butyrate kinase n=1 Tax=Desulfofundulus salinus TaxID=2419843 RepID=A0A494X3W5_9FIRM|nr:MULTISPECIES: butyrate kinase [Desulfofundulus]RKO67855.1 butyrate kinase [Desulfofundulus salinum]